MQSSGKWWSIYFIDQSTLWSHECKVVSWEMLSYNPPCVETIPVGGKAAGLHHPWNSFHRTENHALPHSSGLHNWKHLGMKIESRWHINGRVLQGHADKKRLHLLTGFVHDRVTGPPLKDSRLGVDSNTNSYSWSVVRSLVIQFTSQ